MSEAPTEFNSLSAFLGANSAELCKAAQNGLTVAKNGRIEIPMEALHQLSMAKMEANKPKVPVINKIWGHAETGR